MILDIQNLVGLGLPAKVKEKAGLVSEYLAAIKNKEQGFLALPRLKAQVLAVKSLADGLKGKFDDIVVLGIGGSALGVTCIRDAIFGKYSMYQKPRLFVLDNLDLVSEVEKLIDPDKTLFIVISKSGSTPETMAQYFYFKEKVSKENFIFITDPESGELRKIAEKFRIPTLDIPPTVGGRFSVLSPVGLFPSAMMGVDIEEMLAGAEEMAKSFERVEVDLNLAFQIATIQYLLDWEQGIRMTVLMPYSSRLYSFADWYRQLLAESIGKDGKGITPVIAMGVTDQHSQLQLYNEGPNDKLILFIEVEEEDKTRIPIIGNESLKYLSGHSFGELMRVEKKATEQALTEYEKANITVKIPKVDEKNLGKLFMLFETSIAFLGEYYRINAFDQPGVELGKKLTKEILSKK